jgi:hypothetical protein
LVPELDALTGHLPLGRHRATYAEVYARFVEHDDFKGSPTRCDVWAGFSAYMTAWRALEELLADHLDGKRLATVVWLGGSFISLKHDPKNVDVTVFIDGDLADSCRGIPGVAGLKKLAHRDGMLSQYMVSPCIVRQRYFRSPFRAQLIGNPGIEDYVMMRGAWDDWWQRVRPAGEPKGEPTKESATAFRGYLEVEA